jgi:hypothetical protein
MSLWVVRAGRYGEQEETALKEHLVCHGWNELPDYSMYRTKDELQVLYKATYPQATEKQVISGRCGPEGTGLQDRSIAPWTRRRSRYPGRFRIARVRSAAPLCTGQVG